MPELLLPELSAAPVAFARQALQDDPWGRQEEILAALATGDRVTVRSAHGVGKTHLAATAALWFAYTRTPAVVLTTAPTFRQVKHILWREIRSLHRRLPENSTSVNQTELRIDADRFALGLSTDEPDQFQGFHCPHLLVIVDEAAGVAEEIFAAIDGLLTSHGAKLLLIGNPTSSGGTFHASHQLGAAEIWSQHAISALDSPNVAGIDLENPFQRAQPPPRPYLVTPEWVWDKQQRWGTDSPVYKARVLGEFAAGGLQQRPHLLAGRPR